MQNDVHIYCVGCGRVVAGDQAQMVFRTGFYKITTPLGVCGICAAKPAEPADAPEAVASELSTFVGGRSAGSGCHR